MTTVAQREHLNWLDGIRGLLCLWVVLYHALSGAWPGRAWWHQSPVFWIAAGGYPVIAFIVISGFCLMLPIVRTNKVQPVPFLLGRAARILPPYFAALFLTLAIIRPAELTDDLWSSIKEHLLLVHQYTGHALGINPTHWSIGVEWDIYLLFPLIVWGWVKFGANSTLAVLAGLGFSLFYATLSASPNASPQFLYFFGLGCLGAWHFRKGQIPDCKWGIIALSLIVVALVPVFLLRYSPTLITPDVRSMLTSPTIYALRSTVVAFATVAGIFCVIQNATVRRVMEWKPLVWIGTFSYSLYLTHAAILWPMLKAIPNPVVFVVAFVVASIILGWAFYFIAERPSIRLAQYVKRRATRTSP